MRIKDFGVFKLVKGKNAHKSVDVNTGEAIEIRPIINLVSILINH